jgi:uncharacterized protein YbbK (DUF523 family)
VILVSACLLGQNTRYDGKHSLAPGLDERLTGREYIALCPELLGGLGVPRLRASIQGGRHGREGEDVLAGRARIVNAEGADVSQAFIQGARIVLQAALSAGVAACLLKDRSPSCAWDPLGQNPGGGPGQGVLTALLLAHGLKVTEIRASAVK